MAIGGNAGMTGRSAAAQARARVQELEQRRRELEGELGDLDQAQDDKKTTAELEAKVAELESELEQRRKDMTMDKRGYAAAAIRKQAEDIMDRYAESIREGGETREQAYARAYRTEFGGSVLANIDRAYEQQVAAPDAGVLDKKGGRTPAEVERELDGLARRRAAESGAGYAKAYAEVLDTPDGRRLYAEHGAAAERT